MEFTESALYQTLGAFLRKGERVLVCLPSEESSQGRLFADAVRSFGGIPEFWGEDIRWKTLLKLAFFRRYTAVIGSPGIVLGLRKVAKATLTPLFFRNAVLTAPSTEKMREDLSRGLDCQIWDITNEAHVDLPELTRHLLPWSSVLDYRVSRTEYGLDLEVVIFPGEKLPRLPSCAKLTLRPWDPERDVPFSLNS